MDEMRFDALSRVFGRGPSRRTIVRGLLGAGVLLGGMSHASGNAGAKKRRRKKARRNVDVVACHNGETIQVPRSAVRGLLLNGDTLGPCPAVNPPRGAPPACDVCPTCQFQTIQDAVDAAGTTSIRLCAGTYEETIQISGNANLGVLVITGTGSGPGGTVLDGGGFGSVLTVGPEAPTVIVQRLTITGGNAEQGGGVFVTGSNLTLTNVRVTANTATLGGGGIGVFNNASLTLSATDVANNTARNGGGILIAGSGTAVLNNGSTVTGNRATTNGGGIANSGGTVALDDAVVSGNTPNNCIGVTGC
jgi:hypothetical protein